MSNPSTPKNPKTLHWIDVQEIAWQLSELYPDIAPLTLRFTDLHKKVMALPNFVDAADKSNEKILETIQMLWHEEA